VRDEQMVHLPENVIDDPSAREQARLAVPPVVDRYPKGMLLAARGEPISDRQLELLEKDLLAFMRSMKKSDHIRRGAAFFLINGLLALVVVLYVRRFQRGLAESLPKITTVCTLVVAALALGLLLSRPPWFAVLIPLTVTSMVLSLAYNAQFSLLLSFSMTLAMT